MDSDEDKAQGVRAEPATYIQPRPHHWLSRAAAIAAPYGLTMAMVNEEGLSLALLRYAIGPLLEPGWLIFGAPFALLHGLVSYLFPWSFGWWLASVIHIAGWGIACLLASGPAFTT